MSKNYNSQLQSNNIDLLAILTTINELPDASGGSDPVLQDKTVTPTTSKQTVTADSGYDGLDTVTVNAMPTATQATPSITVNSNGLITATTTQTAGYVAAGSKSATKQLAFQAAKTITPKATSQIAVSSGYYTGGNITVAGDANLKAENIKNGISIFGVSGTLEGGEFTLQNKTLTENGTYTADSGYDGLGTVIVDVEGGDVDHSVEDAMIDGTLTTYNNDRVTSIRTVAFQSCKNLISASFPMCSYIGSNAFGYCDNLTTIDFPMCSYIGDRAFLSCSKLISASFPACSHIGNYAFSSCYELTTIDFPACSYISNGAFNDCSKITTANFPVCSYIGSYAFSRCFSLTTIDFPVCLYIGGDAFGYCSNLISASFPMCSYIGSYAFRYCDNLTTIDFPVCSYISSNVFRSCVKLTTANFPVCSYIGSYAFTNCTNLTLVDFGDNIISKCSIYASAFANCSKLTTLILRYSSLATLSNINAFANTPMSVSTFTGSFGSIYVPASLVDAYKSATNWATYANRIVAIEGGGEASEIPDESEPTLISFTIEGTSYQAEEGMTWAEWVNSDYNTGNYIVSGTNIGKTTTTECVMKGNALVSTTEAITNNFDYTFGTVDWID